MAALLPVHLRSRDEESGGLLAALLQVVGSELDLLRTDLDDLYRAWFVETCAEWVVPYLADLVGVADLPPETAGVSRRAFVANTIGYRRRKGTVAVIEQVARDASGWPVRAVEFFRVLAGSAHLNHVRLDRPATASLRSADRLDLVPPGHAYGALDPFAHTGEVRHIAGGRGRYQIPHVGVFLFPLQVYDFPLAATEQDWPQAVPAPVPASEGLPAVGDGSAWLVHPLGLPTPLFAAPATEDTIEHLASEADLPVPLRPRRLLAALWAARANPALAAALPVGVLVDGQVLSPERIRVSRLEDLADVDGPQVMVDPALGWLRSYVDQAPSAAADVRVLHAYAARADLGAGTYDRSEIHDEVRAGQGYVGDGDTGRGDARAQVLVTADGPLASPAAALSAAETAWADPADSPAGGTFVVAVGDSSRYDGDLTVAVPEATRLTMVAATWRDRIVGNDEIRPRVIGEYSPEGLRPVVVGDLRLTGAPGSAVLLDGLVVTGDVVVAAGDLGRLTVSQCTIAGRVRVEGADGAANGDCRVVLRRTRAAGVDLAADVPELTLVESIVDALPPELANVAVNALTGVTGPAVTAPGAAVVVTGCTVRGGLTSRSLNAGNSILDGAAVVEHRQIGCVRYSYVGPGSRVPRRFSCVPPAEGAGAPSPVYVSIEPGSPSYLALAPGCPADIRAGAEGDGEMGAYHHLQAQLRVQATRRLLAPYVPVGLEIGTVGG
nr:phage tail protein [Actinopolymorpha rutila]